MSTMPSLNSSIPPVDSGSSADSKTASPPTLLVTPPPTVLAGPRNPGNATVSPPTLIRGSTASSTWTILASSPGETTSTSTPAMQSAARARRPISSRSMARTPPIRAVREPNSTAVTRLLSSLRFTALPRTAPRLHARNWPTGGKPAAAPAMLSPPLEPQQVRVLLRQDLLKVDLHGAPAGRRCSRRLRTVHSRPTVRPAWRRSWQSGLESGS